MVSRKKSGKSFRRASALQRELRSAQINPRRRFTRSKTELARELARNRQLERKYAKRREAAEKAARSQERSNKRLAARRKREADALRERLKAKARVKLLRPYIKGLESDDGFNLREAREWDAKQLRKVAKVYDKLAPFVLKPHVKVVARTARKRKALTEFAGMEKPPKGMKAVPVVTPQPERTDVSVTDDGIVQVRVGRVIQRHYFVPDELEDEVSATKIAREMLKSMPAGIYFVKTGEHEAYQQPAVHDPDADDEDNLLLRQVKFFVRQYGSERVANFFRGFRWIAASDDIETAQREIETFKRARAEMDRLRAERRRVMSRDARRKARRIIRK